jgi:hypothetical protein
MAVTWTIDIIPNRKEHFLTIIFRETDGEYKETYSIAVEPGGTGAERKQRVLAKLKTEVLKRRAMRQKIEQIKSAITSEQIEAFINS